MAGLFCRNEYAFCVLIPEVCIVEWLLFCLLSQTILYVLVSHSVDLFGGRGQL